MLCNLLPCFSILDKCLRYSFALFEYPSAMFEFLSITCQRRRSSGPQDVFLVSRMISLFLVPKRYCVDHVCTVSLFLVRNMHYLDHVRKVSLFLVPRVYCLDHVCRVSLFLVPKVYCLDHV